MKALFAHFNTQALEEWKPLLESPLLRIILALLIALLLLRLSRRLINEFRIYMALNGDDTEEIKRSDTLARVFKYTSSVIIFTVTSMFILSQIGISIGPILGAAGVVGIAIGFGAQSLVKDFFIGFFLLLENQIRQGDIIQIGTKDGEVEEITLRYIRLRDYEGNVHFIPNSVVSIVTNKTRDFAFAVMEIDIPYDADIENAIEIMTEVSHSLRIDPVYGPKILADIEIAGIEKISNGAIQLKGRIKVNAIEQWDTKREFMKRVKIALQENGIEMPFPHMTIYNVRKLQASLSVKARYIPKDD